MKKTFRATYYESGNQITVVIEGQRLEVTQTGTLVIDIKCNVCVAFFPSNVVIYEVKTDV